MFRPAILEVIHLQYGGRVRALGGTAVAAPSARVSTPVVGAATLHLDRVSRRAGVRFFPPARRRFMKVEG